MSRVYKEILQLLKTKENFEFEAYKMPMLIRRIDNRIAKIHHATPENYLVFLRQNTEESKELLNNFLINVSHFFRDPLTYEFIKKDVIPELISLLGKKRRKPLRIWSAGCARGEEPYSLAILIAEYCEKVDMDIEIDFFATDYDPKAIAQCKIGEYNLSSFGETKMKYIDKYFTKCSQNYKLNETIKSNVQFSAYNLLDKNGYAPSESIYGEFDLILCRNVLIYFNEKYQNIIFEKIYKSLLPNKLLVLGDSELPPVAYRTKFKQVNSCCKIYRKIDNEN